MTSDDVLARADAELDKGNGAESCPICYALIRDLTAEVRRLRDRRYNRDVEMAERLRLTEADLAALRQRHAAAVEAAYREGYMDFDADPDDHSDAANAAWLASEAKARLT